MSYLFVFVTVDDTTMRTPTLPTFDFCSKSCSLTQSISRANACIKEAQRLIIYIMKAAKLLITGALARSVLGGSGE